MMNIKLDPFMNKTLWHHLLGSVQEQLLSPVGIEVYLDSQVMRYPPNAEIILLLRDSPTWTTEQLIRLPDGIRDNHARHILIGFEYTESVNEESFLLTLGYDTFYKLIKHLTAKKLQTFLVCAKNPQVETLSEWGYVETECPGVYRTEDRIFGRIILLSLNQLADEPHNAFFKCFASHSCEKQKAFATLNGSCVAFLTNKLERILTGLHQCWFSQTEEEFMKQSLTPETVMAMGQQWLEAHLARLPVDERLKGLTPQEVVSRFTPQERLIGLKPQEVLDQLEPEKIEEYLNQLKRKQARRKGN